MSIRFKNGHNLDFACGAGALAFDGRGWFWEWPFRWAGLLDPKAFTVVAKTVTVNPVKGNLSMWHPWTCVALIRNKRDNQKGATNAIGLTNPGIDYWIKNCYQTAKKKGYAIAASVKADSVDDAVVFCKKLRDLDLAYIETNISCPNVAEKTYATYLILEALRDSGVPIVLKLSWDQVQNKELIDSVDDYVDAYHAINTVPWNTIFPHKRSPIEKYSHKQKGGVSGTFLREYSKLAVKHLSSITKKPIIGGGGIFEINDIVELERAGASAFSIGSCFLYYPWVPNALVEECPKFLFKQAR